MNKTFLTTGLLLGSLALFSGLAPLPATAQSTEATLFDRLGGMPAIEAVISQFVDNNNADEMIAHRWKSGDVDGLKQKLSDLVCEVTGGPCVYYGAAMVPAHTGHNITDAEFNQVAGNLVAALNQFEVPEQEQGELLAIIGSLHDQVVGH